MDRENRSPTSRITQEVLKALCEGNHEAYRLVYLEYADPLTNYIERLTGRRSVAEDLVQEIMACIWAKHASIHIHTSLKSYLYTTARNAVSNYRRGRQPVWSAEFGKEWVPETEFNSKTDEMLIAGDIAMLVQLAMLHMPRQRRLICELKNGDGLSNDEIAGRLGISKAAVEKQVSYARREFREIFGQLFFI